MLLFFSWFSARYIVVCFPFKASALCNTSRARKVIAFLASLMLAINSHFFWTSGIGKVSNEGSLSPIHTHTLNLSHSLSLYLYLSLLSVCLYLSIDLSLFTLSVSSLSICLSLILSILFFNLLLSSLSNVQSPLLFLNANYSPVS